MYNIVEPRIPDLTAENGMESMLLTVQGRLSMEEQGAGQSGERETRGWSVERQD